MRILLPLLLLFSVSTQAQVVLSCDHGWGASKDCGGCSGLVWRTPTPNIKVKTDSNDFWVELSTLRPKDKVFTHATKKDGEPAACKEGVATKVSALTLSAAATTASTPPSPVMQTAPTPPAPSPPPPATPVATAAQGSSVISWNAPRFDTAGHPAVITGYHLRWNGGEAIVGKVLTYAFSAPPGTYSLTISTINGKEESERSNPVTVLIRK